MKIDRWAIFVMIMTLALSLYIFFTLAGYVKKVSVPPAKEGRAEGVERPRVYNIPENTIPPVQEIEEAIEKARQEREERKAVTARIAAQAVRPSPAREEVPEEKKTAPVPQVRQIPEKKEVKFPTHEERKASKSLSGVVVY